MAKTEKPGTGKWRALVGFNYPPNSKRAEAGDTVTDLLSDSVEDAVAMGVVEPVDATAKKLAGMGE